MALIKKIIATTTFLVLFVIGLTIVLNSIKQRPSVGHPFPYVISEKLDPNDIKAASEAHILIVGDKMGHALAHYIPYINNLLASKLNSPLKIYNWARKNESIVRTLYKIKSLKKIPPLIIYHGSADEFYEKLFEVKDYTNLLVNIQRFNHPHFSTLLEFAPFLAKFIFKPTTLKILNDISPDTETYTDLEQQHRMEITYSLYQYHLEEMIKIIKQNDSEILLLTTPLNYKVAPRAVCSHTTTNTLSSHLVKLENYIQKHQYKNAYFQLKELSQSATSNAHVFYLLGQASFMLGKWEEAKTSFNLSTSFDCLPWRSNAVFNSIIEKAAYQNRLKLINFNELVNNQHERRVLFTDVFFPQPIFYEEICGEITQFIRSLFRI